MTTTGKCLILIYALTLTTAFSFKQTFEILRTSKSALTEISTWRDLNVCPHQVVFTRTHTECAFTHWRDKCSCIHSETDNMAQHQCCGRTAQWNLEIAADPWHLTKVVQTSLLYSTAVDFLSFKSIRGHQVFFLFLHRVQSWLRGRRVELSGSAYEENVFKSLFEKRGKVGDTFVVNRLWRLSSLGAFPLRWNSEQGSVWDRVQMDRPELRGIGRVL